ncbi:B12-binding domain-containing radical SAM protein [Candidatus Bathyarchaeota archaeon]|nr:B12-binding domain-containing radical SAM protein [Candidatus Bathyarchaeota archaeon]
MKVHVVLANPPYPDDVPQAVFIPLGISYLVAVLEEKGYEVDVVDCQVSRPNQKQLEDKFRSLNPDIIGVTAATVTYLPALKILKAAKAALPSCITMIGGPHVTVLDERTFTESADVDIVVRGEGEQTMLELASLVSDGNLKSLSKVAGITFRKNGQVYRTPDRPFIQDIDSLPRPAHKHFDVTRYKISGKIYMPIITSRGCPFNCAFCLASKMCGRGFRARSPSKVVDELEWLRDTFGAGAFAFYDDTFTFDVNRAIAICDEMKARKFGLPWDCRTRVDKVSKELLTKLRSTNCQLIHFGVESGSQQMLNTMRKGTTVEQNARAIKWAKESGILVAISLVIGYPGETPEMLQQTIDFIHKTKPDYVYMCEAVPYPGTELYSYVKELGLEMTEDWNKYHEQMQVFKNTLLPLEKLEETKKALYDSFFTPTYFLQKKLRGDFHSQIMARMALNHLVWKYKFSRWAFKQLGRVRHPKKSPGGHSTPSKDQQD